METTTVTTVTTVTKSTTVTTVGEGEGWGQSKKNQLLKTAKNVYSEASKKLKFKKITNCENIQRSISDGSFHSKQLHHQISPTSSASRREPSRSMTPARNFARKVKQSIPLPSFICSKRKSTSTTSSGFGGGCSSIFTSDEGGGGDMDVDHDDDVELWRRNILMGEKCDPLNFSGTIFYDSDGKIMDKTSSNPRTSVRRKLPTSPMMANNGGAGGDY